jgi:hypothetical protein
MRNTILATLLSFGIVLIASGSRNWLPQSANSSDDKLSVLTIEQQKKESDVKTVYTCPMHSEVVQDKPGKCPKCGMDLTAKEVKKDTYLCPMHSEVTQDKPGKCPKCGMNLVLKEPAKIADPTKK